MKLYYSLAATAALLIAVATPARATPIAYTLSASGNSMRTANPINFTGTFVFDPSGPTLDHVSITSTGFMTITFDTPATPISADEISATSSTGFGAPAPLEIVFTNPLTNAPDTVASIAWGPTSGPTESLTNPQGQVVPAAATPEPSALFLMGGALGLFLLVLGATRHGRQAPPSQPSGA